MDKSSSGYGTIELDGSTNNHIYISGSDEIYACAIKVTPVAAANAPSTPTFTPDGGDVNGNTTVTVASTDASTIYYYWSASSTPAEKGDASYTEASGSSVSVTVPNETATKYLHAYGWNNYNSGSTSSIYSKSFSVTQVQAAAGLAYATAAITKNVGDANFTNTLTNPNSLSVTYSITNNGTGTTINSTTGEVTVGTVAGEETITASSAATSDYLAGEATYTLTVTKECAAPVITFNGYDYEEEAWSFTATSSDGSNLQYRLSDGDGTYTSCTTGVPFYVVGNTAANGSGYDEYKSKLIVKATKSGFTEKSTTTGYYLQEALDATSPEHLVPYYYGNDNGLKNHQYGYTSVKIGEEANTSSVCGTGDHSTGYGKYLKLRINQNSNSVTLYVNKGYKVTNVTIQGYSNSSTANAQATISALAVDGTDKTSQLAWGDETEYFPLSNASTTKTCSTGTIAATETIKFTFGQGGSASMATQMLANITVTYERNTASKDVESYGWATYITPDDVTFGENDAYVVTDVNTSTGAVTVENVTAAPANTPVLLKTTGTKTITYATATQTAPETNLLSVSDGTANGTKVPYVLAKNGEGAGFKQWTGSVSTLNGRVVLWLDSALGFAREFFFLDDEAGDVTGINAVQGAGLKVIGEYYNLNGQRVAQPTKGLYIVNGKKYIVK